MVSCWSLVTGRIPQSASALITHHSTLNTRVDGTSWVHTHSELNRPLVARRTGYLVDLSLFLGEKLLCADMDGHAPARPRTLGAGGGGGGGQPMVLGSFPQALLDTVIGACATCASARSRLLCNQSACKTQTARGETCSTSEGLSAHSCGVRSVHVDKPPPLHDDRDATAARCRARVGTPGCSAGREVFETLRRVQGLLSASKRF